jgi:TDG/mug DNA glycosylase family protein
MAGRRRRSRSAGSQDGFPDVFVLASPSGAASGHWTIEPWRELADAISA